MKAALAEFFRKRIPNFADNAIGVDLAQYRRRQLGKVAKRRQEVLHTLNFDLDASRDFGGATLVDAAALRPAFKLCGSGGERHQEISDFVRRLAGEHLPCGDLFGAPEADFCFAQVIGQAVDSGDELADFIIGVIVDAVRFLTLGNLLGGQRHFGNGTRQRPLKEISKQQRQCNCRG